jgi:hypothetical protein
MLKPLDDQQQRQTSRSAHASIAPVSKDLGKPFTAKNMSSFSPGSTQ